MNLLKYLLSHEKPNGPTKRAPRKHPYYGAKVVINEDEIRLNNTAHQDDIEQISKDIFLVAVRSYCEEKPNGEYWVLLKAEEAGISVTSRADGFAQLEEWLFSLEGFDREDYTKATKEAGDEAVVVWTAELPSNAVIVNRGDQNSYADLDEGIRLEKRNRLLPWGTFKDLEEVEGIQKNAVDLPNPSYKQYSYVLKNVQILNGLQVDELTFKTPSWCKSQPFNSDWPITGFFTSVRLAPSANESYQGLKAHFVRYLGEPDYENEFPSSTQTGWTRGNNKIELNKSRYQNIPVYHPGCSLRINHAPEVDRFYTGDYQQQLELHDNIQYTIIETEIEITHSYVSRPQAWYTPDCFKAIMTSQNGFVIWRDEKAGKLGFGNKAFCHIYDESEIHSLLFVHDYFRDKLRGCRFFINRKKKDNRIVDPDRQIGSFKTVDPEQWERIKTETGRIANKPCNGTVDNQYY